MDAGRDFNAPRGCPDRPCDHAPRGLHLTVNARLPASCCATNAAIELASYALTKAELVGFLGKLDRMGFLRLHPNNRYKLLVARTFAWIPNGPIQQIFKEHAADFFDCAFDGPSESMLLLNGRLSAANSALLISRLKRTAREFSDQHNEDAKLPADQRQALSLLLAVRPWQLKVMRALWKDVGAKRVSAKRL